MKPKLRPGTSIVEIDEEAILYEPTLQQIHYLNPTAAVVLQLCDGTATVKQTATELAEAYGMDPQAVEADVRNLVRAYRKNKVLIAAGTSEEQVPAGRAADKRERVRMEVPTST